MHKTSPSQQLVTFAWKSNPPCPRFCLITTGSLGPLVICFLILVCFSAFRYFFYAGSKKAACFGTFLSGGSFLLMSKGR